MADWSLARPTPDIMGNALAAFDAGRQTAATRRAGNALASGDTGGAANALYGAGMLNEGAAVQDRQRTMQRQDMQDQRATVQDQRQTQLFDAQTKERLRGDVLREAKALRMAPEEMRAPMYEQRAAPILREIGVPDDQIRQVLLDGKLTNEELDMFITQMGGEQGGQERGVVVGPGGRLYNPVTGELLAETPFAPQYRAVGEGQTLHEIDPNNGGSGAGGPMMDIASAEQAILGSVPGTAVTSGQRSPEQNARVGGVPNSYHLTGEARDFRIPQGMAPAAFAAQVKAQVGPGWDVINEGDHVHIEPARRAQGGGSRVIAQGAPKQGWRAATTEEKARMGHGPEVPAQVSPDGKYEAPASAVTAAQKATEKAEKRTASLEAAKVKAGAIISTVDSVLGKLGMGESGVIGSTMSKVPGTQAYDVEREIETIKANLGFQELQAMREASPTGGALGAIAVQELVALQATVANLDIGQSEKQLRANLNKVKSHYQRWLNAAEGRTPTRAAQPARASAPAKASTRPSLDAIFK